MTAPGENLEFKEAARFKARSTGRSGLQEAVLKAIKSRPREGRPVAGPVYELDFFLNGQIWTVHYSLRGVVVGLMHVFGPGDERGLEAHRRAVAELFNKEGR